MNSAKPIPAVMIRGGTSRGVYFHKADLPLDEAERDALLVRIMGGPDSLQVDGIGGGHPLTSKVAIISKSREQDADVDYLFLQVDPKKQTVTDAQNCGNLLAGVGLYAMDRGMVEPGEASTKVRVFMRNTGTRCDLEFAAPGSREEVSIDGVPGKAPPILCNYLDTEGSSCGALLPTGNSIDEIDGVLLTCVDMGMPVVVLRATDLGIQGSESPEELDANLDLKDRLESIRLRLGPRMNLGDVAQKSIPKMCLVSAPQDGGTMMTRTFIPHSCHKSIGVLGALSVATAALIPSSVTANLAEIPPGNPIFLKLEHPSGSLQLQLETDETSMVRKAAVVRTARILFKGDAYP